MKAQDTEKIGTKCGSLRYEQAPKTRQIALRTGLSEPKFAHAEFSCVAPLTTDDLTCRGRSPSSYDPTELRRFSGWLSWTEM